MKQVILLVGPKGAGKTTIGEFLAGDLGVRFLRVEPLFLEAHARLGPSYPDPDRLGFEAVLASLTAVLRECDTACLESTGASPHFAWLLAEMGKLARVALVRVLADPAQCIARIHCRDAAVHIPVSDDTAARINARAGKVALPGDAVIDNRGRFDGALIRQVVRALIDAPVPVHGGA